MGEIKWFDPAETLPEDGQECLLMPHFNDRSLVTLAVFGPIPYDAKMKGWCDLFRSSEAGTVVAAKTVGCWTLWEPLAPPEDLPTPFPDDPP